MLSTPAPHALGLFLLQDPAAASSDAHLTMIFMGIAACSLLFIALVILGGLIASGIVITKARTTAEETIAEFRLKAYPIFEKGQQLITDLTPTIKNITTKTDTLITTLSPTITSITENVRTISGHSAEISAMVKDKITEFSPTITAAKETFMDANTTVRDANQKTHEQIVRVNGIVTSVLEKTNEMVETIHEGIRKPAREVAGIVTGIKATVESLIHKTQGFGAGFTPNPARRAPVRSSYPVAPAYTPAEPMAPRPSAYPTRAVTPESAAAAATQAFNQAEKPDLGL